MERVKAFTKAKAKGKDKRRDPPPESNLIRGSKSVALRVARDVDAQNAAEEAYEKGWTASGGIRPATTSSPGLSFA